MEKIRDTIIELLRDVIINFCTKKRLFPTLTTKGINKTGSHYKMAACTSDQEEIYQEKKSTDGYLVSMYDSSLLALEKSNHNK